MHATVTLHRRARNRTDVIQKTPQPVKYVIVQVAGRWMSDRSWVVCNAHPQANADTLDLHAHARERPWDVALDDANRVGGGGRQGYSGIIFRSAPLAVCFDEPLPCGSVASFTVHCMLPDIVPATFRGDALRYSYFMNVIAATNDDRPQVLRVPFRVVLPQYYAFARSALTNPIPVPTPRSTGPVPNRFLDASSTYALAISCSTNKSLACEDIDDALATTANGRLTPFCADDELWKSTTFAEDEASLNQMRLTPSPPRTPNSSARVPSSPKRTAPSKRGMEHDALSGDALPMYHISRGSMSLAKMYLLKRTHHLGDTLTAIFDFQQCVVPCYRLNARLECHEIVQASSCQETRQSLKSQRGVSFRKVYGDHDEFVVMNQNTNVTFSIPHDAPVSFATGAVHVRWLLHFVFLIPLSKHASQASSPEDSAVVQQDLPNGPAPDSVAQNVVDSATENEDESAHGDETPLLTNAAARVVSQNEGEISGWEGGDWKGNDPRSWDFIPRMDVDVLRWTLPLNVTGLSSCLGPCSSAQITLDP